jgi:thioredoxin reductase
VAYNLLEPEHYTNEKITVVGGGDSAIEAAIALSEQPGNTVRLSYRKNTFSRLKPKNNEKLREAVDNNTITLQLNSNVVENTLNSVTLSDNDKKLETLENDSLFIFAGGILPTAFLREIGIKIDHKFGEP